METLAVHVDLRNPAAADTGHLVQDVGGIGRRVKGADLNPNIRIYGGDFNHFANPRAVQQVDGGLALFGVVA